MVKKWSSTGNWYSSKKIVTEDKEMSGQDLITALTYMSFYNIISGFFAGFLPWGILWRTEKAGIEDFHLQQ